MAMKKPEQMIKDLNPPRWKLWITSKVRREAARSLGRMRKAEALLPLVELLADPAVQDAAIEAIEDIKIPDKQAALTLKAVLAFRQALKGRFVEEYFNEEHNAAIMKTCGGMPVATMKAEPESFLGAALSIYSQLHPDKAPELEQCARQGLAPYSRKKFRENIKILADHELFPTWPELDMIEALFEAADRVIVKIAGKDAAAKVEGLSDTSEGQAPPSAQAPDRAEVSEGVIADFVSKALESKSAITVSMNQVPVIMDFIFREIKNRYPRLDSQEIFKLLSGAIFLNCHYCGPLPPQYTQGLLLTVREAFEQGTKLTSEMFTGRSAGSFAKGHGPGCPGTGVELVLDPGGIELPAKAIESQREAAEKNEQAAEPKTKSKDPAPEFYNVIFCGDIIKDADVETVKKGLAALYKVDVSKVAGFFSGQPKIVKKNINLQTAQKMVKTFEKVGAKATIQAISK